jgi:hypothetical protein
LHSDQGDLRGRQVFDSAHYARVVQELILSTFRNAGFKTHEPAICRQFIGIDLVFGDDGSFCRLNGLLSKGKEADHTKEAE